MSSLFNIAAGGQAGFYDYQINNSLRFDDGSSHSLTRTPASAGNRRTFTWSGWIKRGNLGVNAFIWSAGVSGTNNHTGIHFGSSDVINFTIFGVGGQATSSVFRDVSAWYHVVLAVDTTQATEADRLKIYVNNVRQTTSGQSIFSLNYQSQFNNTTEHRIGKDYTTSSFFDGYIAEVNFIDGQALDPTSFGETKSGVWVPKDTSGLTFGTNGYRLEFGDSSAIGDDTSGNGNDYTVNNLSAHDVVPDSPTNNFAVLNENDEIGLNSFGEGSLRYSGTLTTTFGITRATFSASNHKCYWETYGASYSNTDTRFGLMQTNQRLLSNSNDFLGLQSTYSGSVSFEPSSGKVRQSDGTYSSAYTAASGGDVINHAFDPETGKYWIGINGTYINSGDPESGTGNIDTLSTTGAFAPAVSDTATGDRYFNFGQDGTFAGNKTSGGYSDSNGIGNFFNQPPSNFLALCTANLPEPSITPLDDDLPEDYFNTVIYTGNGTANREITGVGFQPDFSWFKARSSTNPHNLTDSIRGAGFNLSSNSTNAEVDESAYITGFTSDGIQLGLVGGNTNSNNATYVVWNWLAGGTAVSNTDGSITSSVSANTEAGFSIVGYTGDGAASGTVGHGLSSAPDMIMIKNRDTARNWMVYHSANTSAPETDFLHLNTNNATQDGDGAFNDTAPTSTVFSIGTSDNVNKLNDDYIAYCFHSVEGYSKFGSYTGNGSTDGTFVYTGFRPAFVIAKQTNTARDWHVYDNTRDQHNVTNDVLLPNSNGAEFTDNANGLDLLSNGFKWRTSDAGFNGSGGTYIYMAFAEMPFKYANAR